MSSERYHYTVVQSPGSNAQHGVTAMPIGMDTIIIFRLLKLTGSRWVDVVPVPTIYDSENLIAENGISVLLSDIKRLSERSAYTVLMVGKLSRIRIPEDVQEVVIEEIFQLVQVAIPGFPIIVTVWDVTIRNVTVGDVTPQFMDNATTLDSGDATLQRDAQVILDMLPRETYEAKLIPAAISFIDSLERVTFDSLETAVRTTSCVICCEALDHIAVEEGSDHQLMITRLPCLHYYHGDCIVQWLEKNHLCPLCRYPMPTVEAKPEASEPSRSRHMDMLMLAGGGMLTTAACVGLRMIEAKLKIKVSNYLMYVLPLVAVCSKFL